MIEKTFTLTTDWLDAQGRVLAKAGEVVTMSVSPDDTGDQTEELDTYLGGFVNDEFVADRLSPVVPVDKEAGTRRDFSKENVFEVVETKTGRQGRINEIEHLSETASYRCQEHALAAFVPYQSEADSHPLYNVEQEHGEMLLHKLMLAREVRVQAQLSALASFNAANRTTLTSSLQWDTGGSANPLADLHARQKASAQKVRLIAMNPDVGFYLLSHDKVRSYMLQMLGDAAPSPDVAMAAADTNAATEFRLPGFAPFLICPAKRTNASSGALEYIWGDDVILVSNLGTSHPRNGRGIATANTWRTKGRSGTGIVSNRYMPQGRGINGGVMLEVGHSDDEIVVSSICGGLIKDVLSTV